MGGLRMPLPCLSFPSRGAAGWVPHCPRGAGGARQGAWGAQATSLCHPPVLLSRSVLVPCHVLVPHTCWCPPCFGRHFHHIFMPVACRAVSSRRAASWCHAAVSGPRRVLGPCWRLVPAVSPRPHATPHRRACRDLVHHVHHILRCPLCATSCPRAHRVPVPRRVLVPRLPPRRAGARVQVWCWWTLSVTSSCPPCATPGPGAHRTLESVSPCHAVSWRPMCPGVHHVLDPVVSPCHPPSILAPAASLCPPCPRAHGERGPVAPRSVPATSHPRVPAAAPAGLGAVPLLGDGLVAAHAGCCRWCCRRAGGGHAPPRARVPRVPAVPGRCLTPLLPAEALVNSQEWTLGRSVPEIRLVGTVPPCPCVLAACAPVRGHADTPRHPPGRAGQQQEREVGARPALPHRLLRGAGAHRE